MGPLCFPPFLTSPNVPHLQPLVAAILAAIFLGESLGMKDGIGGALILAGFVVTSFAKYREGREKALEDAKRDPEQADLLPSELLETVE